MAPGRRPPWWLQEALAAGGEPDEAPPLRGGLDVDVAVVGGGYTGLWTALALRERSPGLAVALLEAAACGEGPSGRNGGFLHGYWASLPRLRSALGDPGALALARAGDRIVPAVRAFCEARAEDVWLREAGMLKVSAAPAQDAAVEQAVAATRELGVPEEAVPLGREELAARCRSPVFRRGVHFRHRRRVRDAAARLPLGGALRARADLPRRRPRRPGRADLAAARRGPGRVRRDDRHPRRRACGRRGSGWAAEPGSTAPPAQIGGSRLRRRSGSSS